MKWWATINNKTEDKKRELSVQQLTLKSSIYSTKLTYLKNMDLDRDVVANRMSKKHETDKERYILM